MRLAITSDVHIDNNGPSVLEALARQVRELAPDVLIVAGDIATGAATFLRTLLALREVAPEVLVVAGNHDVWSSPEAQAAGMDAWRKLDAILPALCGEARVHLLDAGPVVLGGIGFAGSLGWWDLSFRDPSLPAPDEAYRAGQWAGLRWNDHRLASWGGASPEEVAATLRGRLAAHLAALPTDRVVAVTHVLPFREQLYPGADPAWRFVNAFMGSAALGDLIRADDRVELAVAGHTHLPSDVALGRLRAVVSPLGYTREWRGAPAEVAVARAVRVIDLPGA